MLETDRDNLAEFHKFSVTRALAFYRESRREGYNEQNARAQSIAYLRRKTGWSFHLAAGTFDRELADQPITI